MDSRAVEGASAEKGNMDLGRLDADDRGLLQDVRPNPQPQRGARAIASETLGRLHAHEESHRQQPRGFTHYDQNESVDDDDDDDAENGGNERDWRIQSFDVETTRKTWKSGSLLRKMGFRGRSHSFERLDAETGSDKRQPKIFSPQCGRRFTCGFCECLECAVIFSLLFVIITLVLVIRQNVCWTGEDELQLYLDLEDSNGALELFPAGGQPPVPLLHAHSHNDYQQAVPVKLALSAGFCSIEADVFLRSGRLFTGHVQPTSNDLEDQYLRPLVNLAKKNPARPGPINPLASRLGVCEQQTLMVDMKSSSLETWDALETILARVNKESGFRVFECYDQAGMPLPAPEVKRSFLSPVQVIISGISPSLLPELAERLLQRPTHCTRLDGRIDPEHPGPSDASLIRTLGMMSSVWHESFAENLEGTVAAIHAAVPHVKVRFWDTPETPDAWKMLLDAGVDLISTDRISGLKAFLLGDTL